jgi:hypothetical protein
VLLRVIQTAQRLATKRGPVFKAVYTAFQLKDSTGLAPALLHIPSRGAKEHKSRFSTVGICILQSLLNFKVAHVRAVIESIANMEASVLTALACDSAGSRLLESVFKLLHHSEARLRVAHKFLGAFVQLACHPCASFVLDSLFAHSDAAVRRAVAEELAGAVARLVRIH